MINDTTTISKAIKTILQMLAILVAAMCWQAGAVSADTGASDTHPGNPHQGSHFQCPKAGGSHDCPFGCKEAKPCQKCQKVMESMGGNKTLDCQMRKNMESMGNTPDCPMHKPAPVKPAEPDYKAALTSAMYLYKMEIDLLEATGNGFASFVLKSATEKEDFYKKIIMFNRVAMWFHETSVLKGQRNDNKRTLFNRLFTVTKYIEDDMIHTMDEYSKTHKVDATRVEAIRANAAKAAADAGELISLTLKDALPTGDKYDSAVQSVLSFSQFYVLTVAEIEEAYAYALVKKDDIAGNYRELSAKANAAADSFKKDAALDAKGQMSSLYNKIISDKIDFETNAAKIISKVENRGKLTAADTKDMGKYADSAIINMGKMMDLLINNARDTAFSDKSR
ncbi:MAG: hypothetical protein HQL01_11180 [Nitrospirae bacterium]|nr:hypothetical protein [Nitrospirota bacterium]